MRIVSRRQFSGFRLGDDTPAAGTAAPTDDSNIDLTVKPSTAASALGLWVLAGVMTHLAVRIVDRWFFHEK